MLPVLRQLALSIILYNPNLAGPTDISCSAVPSPHNFGNVGCVQLQAVLSLEAKTTGSSHSVRGIQPHESANQSRTTGTYDYRTQPATDGCSSVPGPVWWVAECFTAAGIKTG